MREWFRTKTRSDGTHCVCLTDEHEDRWPLVYELHDDEMPNDWRYQTILDIAVAIDEGLDSFDIAERLTDYGTSDLCRWIADYPGRASYVDDIMSDNIGDGSGVMSLIRTGQWHCIEQMAERMLAVKQEEDDEEV